ncbi:ABC transporter ATP-binding protein [Salipaludibacillus sp. LMS25]|uniref:ABC transporter ATP-binding protein n=1 Tax=Salipaludibacillus sp. LMS25 TaxID=2924031 RepID=UPI0020D1817C|nr:ABC transporter ATP-binding protein [Salipaludibacillus sp. LMS25]UTR13751.1 ABC transporter ATP-binding protein [Salipaludibacillus sp. LMS25]
MIDLSNLSFHYNREQHGVTGLELSVKQGECVILCGKSGCGKTTVTRLLNGLIAELYEGKWDGEGRVEQLDLKNSAIHHFAEKIGSVFQNPKTQFFTNEVLSELVFGCENLGVPTAEIETRLKNTCDFFQIKHLLSKRMFELSGGQKQLIACASVHMLNPSILILDEPSSHLDYQTIEQLRKRLVDWKTSGKTIIISEHRLYYLQGIADRYVVMEAGRIKHIYSNQTLSNKSLKALQEDGLRTLTDDQLYQVSEQLTRQGSTPHELTIENMTFRYKRKDENVLEIPQLTLNNQHIIGLVGRNGAGKSTLIHLLAGLVKPTTGQIKLDGQFCKTKTLIRNSYLVMQDVHYQLFCEEVAKELRLNARRLEWFNVVVEAFELEPLLTRHPLSLSGGQKQRVALGSAILSGKKVILLDEPTSGLDAYHMTHVCHMIRYLQEKGMIVLIISHDIEFITQICERILHIDDHRIRHDFSLAEHPHLLKQIFHDKLTPIKETRL